MTLSAWQFDDLQMFGSDVIVAYPPWDFQNYSDAGTLKGADPHYSVMTLDDIKALRVGELARATGANAPVDRIGLDGKARRLPKKPSTQEEYQEPGIEETGDQDDAP
jgi:hypothetical protein